MKKNYTKLIKIPVLHLEGLKAALEKQGWEHSEKNGRLTISKWLLNPNYKGTAFEFYTEINIMENDDYYELFDRIQMACRENNKVPFQILKDYGNTNIFRKQTVADMPEVFFENYNLAVVITVALFELLSEIGCHLGYRKEYIEL